MTVEKRARGAGLMAALLVLAVVLYSLFGTPALCARQEGSYLMTMDALGLAYLTEEDRAADIVQQFAYKDADLGTLISLAEPGVAYPAALVRLLTAPFGQPFDTRMLAVVYALIIALGGALMVSGLYRHSRLAAVASACALMTLCTYAPVIGYLNSLYDHGAVVAFTVLFLGAMIHCLCRERGCGILPMAGVLVSAALLLRANAQLIIFAPFLLAAAGLCAWHACPAAARRGVYLLACGMVLLWCGHGAVKGFMGSASVHSNATSYLAVFQGYLTVSDDVAGDLEALDLPADQAADVGRSYYEPGENFVYDPKDGGEGQALMENITLARRIGFCLSHPERLWQMAENVQNHFWDAYNDKIVTVDGQTRFMRPSPMLLIDLMLPMAGQGPLIGYLLLAAALCGLCMLVTPKGTGLGKLAAALCIIMAGFACYFPACLVMMGQLDIYMTKVLVFFFGWLGLLVAIPALLLLGNSLCIWLAEQGTSLRPERELCRAVPRQVPVISRGVLLGACALCCLALGLWLLGPEVHVGGVNNGDFGRMMEQLYLSWTPELNVNTADQAGIYVIEEYAYRDGFDPAALTPLDPSYSLLYPTMLVRLWSQLTGSLFSTRVVAVILFAITALCILSVVRDLHPLLGNYTIIPAVALMAMLLGENYVAWYNALYGESMLSVGVIMTLTCALHLIVKERGSRGTLLWLILLAFSIRLMACSKAQMALSLPGGLLLLAVLTIYHRPQKLVRTVCFLLVMVLCAGLVSYDTLRVYMKNDDVSARHTVWQSVFFGALMIADDPDAAMAELGIDPAMKVDIGKHAYYPDEDYVYAPLSEEAGPAFYDHVNTFTMVGYYLKHPKDFLYMLDRAAQESVLLHTGFMAYTDETYPTHTHLQRFTLWQNLRSFTACRAFWQYVLLYGAGLIYCLRTIFKRGSGEGSNRKKLFALFFLCTMCIGAFQYPLTVVGNGFADNNKQLYCFMLCHDIMVVFAVTAAAAMLRNKGERRPL